MIRILKAAEHIDDVAEVVKVGKDILADVFRSVSKLLTSSMELDEFKEIYTKPLDRIILSEEKRTGNKFVGGEFKIFYIDARSFGLSYSLYFQNAQQEWQKMSAKSDAVDTYHLSAEALRELGEKRTIIYDVEEPSAEARKQYEAEGSIRDGQPHRINVEETGSGTSNEI